MQFLTLKILDGKSLKSFVSELKDDEYFDDFRLICHSRKADCETEFISLKLSNLKNEQLWLELRLCIPCPEYTSFWDGYSERDISSDMLGINADPADNPQPLPDKLFPIDPELKRKILKEAGGNTQALAGLMFSGPCKLNVFPASCIYNKTNCIGLGINPGQLFSYNSCGMEKGFFYKSVKLVIDPATTEEVEFIAFKTKSEYGWREGVEKFYSLFPEAYTRRNNIDQRLAGPAETSHYSIENEVPDLLLEDRRRFGSQWIWSMHAYSVCGLIYPHEEDYDPYGTFVEKPVLGSGYKDFIDYVRQAYDNGNRSAAMAYYILPQVLEQEFAEGKYADSVWLNSNCEPLPPIDFGNESHKEKSLSIAVLPWGNSLEERYKNDLREIADKIKPAAIAYDNVEGPRMDFAPHAQNCPGRAFTDGKVYVTQALAYAKLMEFTRKLPGHAEGEKLGVVGNHPGSYHTATLTDAAIFELGPWTDPESTCALRIDMGEKPLIYWGPKEFPNSDNFTGKELEEKLRDINHWLFLFALRNGVLPNPAHNLKGYPLMQERLGLMQDLVNAGWRPVPGAKELSGRLYLQRYGKTYLAVVNENAEQIDTEIHIDLEYYESSNIQVIYGLDISIELQTGKKTHCRLKMPPLSALVLDFSAPAEKRGQTYDLDEQSIMDFDFINSKIIIDYENAFIKKSAQRIVSYFKYHAFFERFGNAQEKLCQGYYQVYMLQKFKNEKIPEIPILVTYSEQTSCIILQVTPEIPEKIKIENENLLLRAPSDAALDILVLKMLKLLDRKYHVNLIRWFTMRRAQQAKEQELMGTLQ